MRDDAWQHLDDIGGPDWNFESHVFSFFPVCFLDFCLIPDIFVYYLRRSIGHMFWLLVICLKEGR